MKIFADLQSVFTPSLLVTVVMFRFSVAFVSFCGKRRGKVIIDGGKMKKNKEA